MKVYFPDTNFFFECWKASDLPWCKPGKGPDIRLIVPSTVSEIERHKAKGSSRTAKRAREASAVLRKALISHGQITELRAASPRVTLELPPAVKVDFSQFPNLDPLRPDHRIAAEFAELLKTEPDLVVITDDTLLTLAVRSLGFEPVLISGNWKLAAEKNERDDEIDRLREELRNYKQTSPDICVILLSADGEETSSIEAEIEVFEPSEDDIERAVASVQARFPIEEDFRRSPDAASCWYGAFLQTWQSPREEEIEAYKTEAYPRWLESVRKTLPSLAAQLNEISQEIPFFVRISNTGFVNATNVRLTITAYDGIMLLDSLSEEAEKDRKEVLSLPSPPQPPRGRYVSVVPTFATTPIKHDFTDSLGSHLLRPHRVDPNTLYVEDLTRLARSSNSHVRHFRTRAIATLLASGPCSGRRTGSAPASCEAAGKQSQEAD